MRKFILISILAVAHILSFAQSPGAVSSGLVVWLKADAGTSGTNDGDLLSYWNDQSGNGNNATQTTPAAQPKLKKFAFNGNPAIETTGGPKYFNVNFTGISSSQYTIFTVVKRTSSSASEFFLGVQQTGPNGLHLGYANNPTLRFSQNGNTANATVTTYSAATESPRMVVAEMSSTSGRTVSEVMDGVLSSINNPTTTLHPITNQGVIGRGFNSNGFTGYIGEVIVYNRILTTAEKKQVETYLSVKYGLSIVYTDHLYYNDATYKYDIFGLGKDLATQGLNQFSSTSGNSDNMLDVSSPSNLDNGEYLIMGNNNGAQTFSAFAGANCSLDSLFNRKWRVKETGSVGTVSLRFNMTGIPSFTASNLVLMVDLNGNGFNDDSPIEGTYSAPYMLFTNIDLNNNDVFTLGCGKANWYAVASGNTNGAIWSRIPTGTPQTVSSWCSRVDVTIKSGLTITANSAVTCKNFNIQSGATFNQGSTNLTVHGTITFNGTYSAGTGSVYLNGTVAQSIAGAQIVTLNDLYCNNAAGVSISGNGVLMKNLLQVNSGTFNTNGKLTLLSDASSTGNIGPLTTGDLTGNVTIQRYRNGTAAGWVNLCSPAQNKTINDWNDDLITTGFPGSDYPSYAFNNIQYYNESAPGNKNQGYVGATNINDNLVNMRGYFVYMNAGVMNLDVDGAIFKGNQSLPVSYTNNGVPAADGWSLVANPYPSTIDWDAAGWTKTNVNDAVYVWNPAISQYTSYIASVGTNGGSRYVPSTQSFFVMANAASASLQITETVKSTNQGSFKSEVDNTQGVISLFLKKGDFTDETKIVLNENASVEFDAMFDAYKLRSPVEIVPYLATGGLGEDADYSINSINNWDASLIIPLRIENMEETDVELTWSGVENLGDNSYLVLEDLFLKRVYRLDEINKLKLHISPSDESRFQLRKITTSQLTSEANHEVAGMLTNEGVQMMFFFAQPTRVQIVAYNSLGQQLIDPITDIYQNEIIHFSNRRYAAYSIVEVTELATGKRHVVRMGS